MHTGQANLSTFNCLNPDNTELVLKGNQWVNPNMPDFKTENKQIVKTIVQMNKERVRQQKVADEVEEARVPFKMERFTKVPAKITAEGLQSQEIDFKRGQLI